jgi:hypothetical protein
MAYKKSSSSGNGGCVWVDIDTARGRVLVKDEHGNVCRYTFAEWAPFLAAVPRGEFDLPGTRMVDRLIDVMWQAEGGVA